MQRQSYQEFRSLLARLESVLDDEESALRLGRRESIAHTIDHKERILAEFVRLSSARASVAPDPQITDEVKRVSRKLKDNLRYLSVHIRATEDVIGTVSQAIAFSESDGTYERTMK